MADAGIRNKLPRSEVRLLVSGESRVLVSRLVGQRNVIVLLSILALLTLVVPSLDLRLDTVVLRCSRTQAACTVTGGEAGGRTIPLSSIVRFEARHPRKQKPRLLAQTRSGDVELVRRWPHEDLGGHAEILNRLLRGGDPAEWAFTYRRGVQALREDLPIFAALFALLAFLLTTQLGWRTRLERREGRVVRRKPLSRSVRPVAEFRTVRVRTMAEANPTRASSQRPQLGGALEAYRQIALVDAAGAAWPITRLVTCPREEVEARASEVAAYLNLPVAKPEEPLGTVLVR